MMSVQNTGSRLEERVALVTGALGGIGEATCKALAAGGARTASMICLRHCERSAQVAPFLNST
ncbi:MAG: SDR family NAD(P)-dependent oxidoreductase [Betaproteobacteria bacterium]|nr:SDR family NAD(P)-dependent oxidoreductase [Betaproteobacteria bacterium]